MAFVSYMANHGPLSQFLDMKYCVDIVFGKNLISLKHTRVKKKNPP